MVGRLLRRPVLEGVLEGCLEGALQGCDAQTRKPDCAAISRIVRGDIAELHLFIYLFITRTASRSLKICERGAPGIGMLMPKSQGPSTGRAGQ